MSPGNLLIPQGAGGGSQPGAVVVRKFPFAYNTAGILTGAALYTPTVGDILLDGWLEIDTAWNGTTPLGDFGTFNGVAYGLLAGWVAALDMTSVDSVAGAVGQTGLIGQSKPASSLSAATVGGAGILASETRWQLKVAVANPIKVVVSQDGTNAGADPGSTQGAAVLYLVTATPA